MTQGIKEGAERARKMSLTLLNHLLKDRVTVHKKFGDLPPVECIRSQIDQVLLNLLANAAQAIPGQGAITIETRREDDAALLVVSDTGPGIPHDVIGRIFDPFFTTKPVGEGTGLGLSISYQIIKKHGGDIRADSPPDGGAVFTVRLPLARTREA
jgi:two-component system NtrC family sensor kinase